MEEGAECPVVTQTLVKSLWALRVNKRVFSSPLAVQDRF